MFTEKEIKYIKHMVYSDLESNCIPPLNNILSKPSSSFPEIDEEEVNFIKTLFSKLESITS